ncbi:MAG: Asp-tRNA(Asn)/Glu-tRNA(Gln) amidotransferase subunit GatC [Firmicutes bacterium]|nr:Asp-tRNA(Asn)/Glu-tRNA(Gln) amidotransferase subunit GatC [Bacillota bacterium]
MITKDEVQKVAHLARLELSEAEVELFTEQLNQVLEAAEKLQQLDTTDVEPTAYAVPMQNVFREDIPEPSMPRDEVLANAPDPKDGYFRVPKIMD